MYRSVAEEENKKPLTNNINVKTEDDASNTQNITQNNKIENNGDKRINNPFVKGMKEEGSKQKNIFEDLCKVSNTQNNVKVEKDNAGISQKIGFKKKANNNAEEKNKLDSQLQVSKMKK
jgi:hypothetical protein